MQKRTTEPLPDPYYGSEPAMWWRSCLEVLDFRLVVHEGVENYAANPGPRHILVAPGMELNHMAAATFRAMLFIENPEWAPEFHVNPRRYKHGGEVLNQRRHLQLIGGGAR